MTNDQTARQTRPALDSIEWTKRIITDLLAASGPCNLGELVAECKVQTTVAQRRLFPTVIDAVSELQRAGTIQEYEQGEVPKWKDYAWELAPGEPVQTIDLKADVAELLSTLYEDAQMGFDGSWDTSEEGFLEQMSSIRGLSSIRPENHVKGCTS